MRSNGLESLGTTALNDQMPDGRPFVWGSVSDIHCIGPYTIIEYRKDNSRLAGAKAEDRAEHGTTQWHGYYDDKDGYAHDCSSTFGSLEAALADAMTRRIAGLNQQAGWLFMRMLNAANAEDENGANLTTGHYFNPRRPA